MTISIDEISAFYESQNEPNKSCLIGLQQIILRSDLKVSETRKYGMPCFCYKNKMFCYLWVDKKTEEPYILFVEGKHLDYPILETGDRKRMKILRIDPNRDLPLKTINKIINSALDLYRNGIVKTK